jgi:hypothetical protein
MVNVADHPKPSAPPPLPVLGIIVFAYAGAFGGYPAEKVGAHFVGLFTWSSRSRRQLPTKRSAIPFCHGL